MPTPVRRLTHSQARDLIESLSSAAAASGVGLELELIPSQPHDVVSSRLAPVQWPGGSRLTYEPGGQVELSGPCLPDAAAACAALSADLAVLSSRVSVRAVGMDPAGGRPRVLHKPRYDAMEAYFIDEGWRMMRDTAALQVNVDVGDDRRWRTLHLLGPVLTAAFANSPIMDGEVTGWKSNRARMWLAIDSTRARAVGGSGASAWVDYAMAAKVMLIRSSSERYEAGDGTMTLADWVEHGHRAGFPDEDDVAYHLTTLFPPIRLRGWLELRFLDSLPSPWWQAAVFAATRLMDQPELVSAVCGGAAGMWREAARDGVCHPVLGAAAESALSAVPEAAEFVDRFTARRRCPGDELLAAATSS